MIPGALFCTMLNRLFFISLLFLLTQCGSQEQATLDIIPFPQAFHPERGTCKLSGSWNLDVAAPWSERAAFWQAWLSADEEGERGESVTVHIVQDAALAQEGMCSMSNLNTSRSQLPHRRECSMP